MAEVAPANQESTDAWSGPLYERFFRFRPFVADGLGAHGEVALAAHPPAEGDRVLDIGCGFGDTTRRLAALVGDGEAVGVDIAAPFLDLAREEAATAGIANVDYRLGDVQIADLGGPYDYVFSRMGVMFFASPVQALRNVLGAMRPGARLAVVVWRRKLDNSWVWEAEQVVDKYLDHPEETDEPTCGPGPFSMADADTVSEQLRIAGFEAIELRRSDLPLRMGDTLDQAVDLTMAIGPAGEVLRLWGDRAEEIRPQIAAEIGAALEQFETPNGVVAPSSTWVISALAPDR
ncbi:MAG TPA: class I SAM-dependent methyltransferase, partial [Solirubrobacterales bacterium]|jgi:SAM-dependent methyltransferase|nr:class I SAM-dependent methyltransferase [Solirubrobacterales bacterium]